MQFVRVAAALGFAIAAPVVLMGTPSAHAETGMNGFLACVQKAGVPPRPHPQDWARTLHVIINDLNGAVPPDQITARLVTMGANPHDSAAEVQCAVENQPPEFYSP
ncbi:hypothetical protein MRAB57_4404 [Mycobacterium rhizamassiliense]|jgi:hypothetical protein|uniref:DUF732 domain-containing protein n=1 Tax=Mycobacterium rhizamassiliense TaxID=1841860 RepID=A0A2U3NYL0_9MYCO|nr:hypothetical protein [Mycobacterium rhizamassiliense]SPM36563.1 hypothetical protein MRAB57_4404 [Mycobacterium rhizamassiliense]